MHNGYYLEKETIEKETGESIDFGFMDGLDYFYNEDIPTRAIYDLLHGYCDNFAVLLHNEFGYDINLVRNKDSGLIHAYCTTEKDGETLYIDIRGITDSIDEFFGEFEDFFDYNDYEDDLIIRENNISIDRLEQLLKIQYPLDDTAHILELIKSDKMFLTTYYAK